MSAGPDHREALEAAEILVVDGDLLAAVDLLVAHDRASRDAAIERRLVELRRDAVAEATPPPDDRPWPDSYPDPAPAVDGLLDIPAAELDLDVLGGALQNRGCLLVRGLLPTDEAAHWVDQIDLAFAGNQAWADGAAESETAPWFLPLDNPDLPSEFDFVRREGVVNRVQTGDCPPLTFELTEFFERSGLRSLAEAYLRVPRVVVAQTKWGLRRFPQPPFNPWHQERSVFGGKRFRTFDVWLALSECGPGTPAPGFDVATRRCTEILPVHEGSWAIQAEHAPPDGEYATPVYEPGDVMILDDLTVHRTHRHPDVTTPRYSVETWFFDPRHRPVEQGALVL